jgi:hypothetical protein
MTSPSHAVILAAAFARLAGNAPLMTLLGQNLFNHLPQETPTPCARVRWGQAGEWDTKDSDGVDGFIFVDVWTAHRGDKVALEAADMIVNLLHLQPLVLSDSQSLILRRDFVDAFTEPDGLTHHTAIRFHHIATN